MMMNKVAHKNGNVYIVILTINLSTDQVLSERHLVLSRHNMSTKFEDS